MGSNGFCQHCTVCYKIMGGTFHATAGFKESDFFHLYKWDRELCESESLHQCDRLVSDVTPMSFSTGMRFISDPHIPPPATGQFAECQSADFFCVPVCRVPVCLL